MLHKGYTTHNFELQVVDFIDFSNRLFMEWEEKHRKESNLENE